MHERTQASGFCATLKVAAEWVKARNGFRLGRLWGREEKILKDYLLVVSKEISL
jgi:hypothetical protein